MASRWSIVVLNIIFGVVIGAVLGILLGAVFGFVIYLLFSVFLGGFARLIGLLRFIAGAYIGGTIGSALGGSGGVVLGGSARVAFDSVFYSVFGAAVAVTVYVVYGEVLVGRLAWYSAPTLAELQEFPLG